MSVGHRRSSNNEDWLWSDKELKLVEEHLETQVKFNNTHDVPYTAGYSKDASTVYIDKEVPKFLQVKAKGIRNKTIKVNLFHSFGFHEMTEKSLEDEPYWIPYRLAHQCALRLEQAYVEALGADWEDYNTKTVALCDEIYARKNFPNMPSNLDPEPMEDENDDNILSQMNNDSRRSKGKEA